ncbi:hypothetical protein DPMN_089301 [Dreissena polymorpha]|uniref:Uncharacterized protein n=1 Tax=Dreissena polymorpha TaxID=45954 RepID=A0A9D4QYQ3_DREPO|nr:hypothetical protein DPMN_089301 [Dreissena polymorpha]
MVDANANAYNVIITPRDSRNNAGNPRTLTIKNNNSDNNDDNNNNYYNNKNNVDDDDGDDDDDDDDNDDDDDDDDDDEDDDDDDDDNNNNNNNINNTCILPLFLNKHLHYPVGSTVPDPGFAITDEDVGDTYKCYMNCGALAG